jgi:hypothetical protein
VESAPHADGESGRIKGGLGRIKDDFGMVFDELSTDNRPSETWESLESGDMNFNQNVYNTTQ